MLPDAEAAAALPFSVAGKIGEGAGIAADFARVARWPRQRAHLQPGACAAAGLQSPPSGSGGARASGAGGGVPPSPPPGAMRNAWTRKQGLGGHDRGGGGGLVRDAGSVDTRPLALKLVLRSIRYASGLQARAARRVWRRKGLGSGYAESVIVKALLWRIIDCGYFV
jgi:hypothetical protein